MLHLDILNFSNKMLAQGLAKLNDFEMFPSSSRWRKHQQAQTCSDLPWSTLCLPIAAPVRLINCHTRYLLIDKKCIYINKYILYFFIKNVCIFIFYILYLITILKLFYPSLYLVFVRESCRLNYWWNCWGWVIYNWNIISFRKLLFI